MKYRFAAASAALVTVAALLSSQPAPREKVGPLPKGGFLLPTGWTLRPAGRQMPLDTFPMSTALSPDGKYMLILNAGYNPPSISVVDVAAERELGRTPVPDGWLGLAFAPGGKTVYVGGGSRSAVFEFSFSNEGELKPARTFEVVPADKRTHRDFIGDVAVSPDGRLLYAADLYHDQILVINPQSGWVIERFKTGRRPYRILFHPDGKSLFVTSWVDGYLHHHQAENGHRISSTRIGAHPTDMIWRERQTALEEGEEISWKARLFIAASHTNNVYVLGVSENKELRLLETINLAMAPRQPVGMTPSALALNADQSRLFVACSDANVVAVADVSRTRSAVLGFLPAGWYPTAVRSLADGRTVVLNGKGLGSRPNPRGPNPSQRRAPLHMGQRADEYIPRIQTGTASFIPPFNDQELSAYTRTSISNTPFREILLDHVDTGRGSPVPPRAGDPTPIQHVVYIVKENRTYDQVLGDMKEGNGDPSLVLFGEDVTPNHHKLAREFVLFDNFYVNSDVSADGHNWSTAAIAPDYVQKLWPNSYAGRRRYSDYAAIDPASLPPAGYIWTNALAKGLTVRNYGYFVNNTKEPGAGGVQVESVRDPSLRPHTNMHFRGFDLEYPDVERVKAFLRDMAEFESRGQMPRLTVMRIGNDHTSGTSPGKISPRSAVADNDFALGLVVEAISKSSFWPKTAIFVLEDDAQNGPDHVDSHRSPAYVISPYARRAVVDSTMYNTTSMLRTMELILGLHPMTVFDAGARPMSSAFQNQPDPRPYTAEKPRISLEERNPASSATAVRSSKLDFTEEDQIDDDELNDILWQAMKGTAAPAPVRSIFAR